MKYFTYGSVYNTRYNSHCMKFWPFGRTTHKLRFTTHVFVAENLRLYACVTHIRIMCVSHTRCKLVFYAVSFSTTICLYGISYNFDTESLLTTLTRIIFLTPCISLIHCCLFTARHTQYFHVLHTHTHTMRVSYMLHVTLTRSTVHTMYQLL